MTMPQNTASRWSNSWNILPIGGDGNMSCRVDHGRLIFTGGDAISRDGNFTWSRNLTTVCDADGLHVVQHNHPGVPCVYQAIPDEANGDFHWLGPAIYDNEKLYAMAPHLHYDGQQWVGAGVDLAVFDVPILGDPVYDTWYAMPKPWADAIIYDKIDNYVYWFGNSPEATDGWTGYDDYVARTPMATLLDQDWEYWTGSTWSANPDLAAPFLTSAVSGGTEIVYTPWHDANGWHIISRYGGTWGTLAGVPTISRWDNATSLTSGSWSRTDIVSGINSGGYSIWYHQDIGKITYNLNMENPVWLDYAG